MMTLLKMTDLDLHHKRVVMRVDFNVPLQEGKITSDARIRACLPSIELALKQEAALILLSHLGRPLEGQFSSEDSLLPVAEHLSSLLGRKVRFLGDWIDHITIQPGEIVLCENVRFLKGENENDPRLAKKMAALGDIFVMEAFATAHRAQASTCGIAEYAKIAAGGPLLLRELDALTRSLTHPARPLVAVVGGAKVSTKLSILESLINKVDQLIVGGGIANTFLAAAGYEIGASLYEPDLVLMAQELLEKLKKKGQTCPLPSDVVVAKRFDKEAEATLKPVEQIEKDDLILDIGPASSAYLTTLLLQAKTIVWNGPVGVFEWPQYSGGTKAIAEAIAGSEAFSLAGGGDTIAAIEMFNVAPHLSYISTAGGAFLEFLEGKTLPAVAILEKRASHLP